MLEKSELSNKPSKPDLKKNINCLLFEVFKCLQFRGCPHSAAKSITENIDQYWKPSKISCSKHILASMYSVFSNTFPSPWGTTKQEILDVDQNGYKVQGHSFIH